MFCALPLRHSIAVASNLSLNKWFTSLASREMFPCLVCKRTNPLVRPIHLFTASSFAWHSVQSFFIHLEWKRVTKCENYKGRRNRANLFPLFREKDDPGKRDFRAKAGIVSKFAFQLETHVHVINISRKNVRQRQFRHSRWIPMRTAFYIIRFNFCNFFTPFCIRVGSSSSTLN